MGRILMRRRERKANVDARGDLNNAQIENPDSAVAGLGDYETLLSTAEQRYLAEGMTPKEAKGAARDEVRGAIREAQALDAGATPEAAARERERAQGNDFRGKLQKKHDSKKEKAKAQRDAAEKGMQSNVDLAEELANRDLSPQTDPQLAAIQQNVLSRLGEVGREGFTDLDRRAMEQAQFQAAQGEKAQRDAALSAAARRGDASGGNALMSSLMAQQGGANRASQYGTDIGLAGRQRSLQALSEQGAMAGQMIGRQDGLMQWATGQKSADTSQLMNAKNMQTQYQLLRAGELKPKSFGEGMNMVLDQAQQIGGTYTQLQSMGGGGGSQARTAQQPPGGFRQQFGPPEDEEQQGGAQGYNRARGGGW